MQRTECYCNLKHCFLKSIKKMKVVIIGAGLVGLVSAVCLAEFGFAVTVFDNDQDVISNLKKNKTPVYEPGLESLITKSQAEWKLQFTSSLQTIINVKCDVVIIAVSTPYTNDGEPDLSETIAAIDQICNLLNNEKHVTIITKIIMPVGTCEIIKQRIKFLRPNLKIFADYDVVTNPHFLREGSAIHDFVMPDREIVGIDAKSKNARAVVLKLYDQLIKTDIPVIFTTHEESEIIKSAANSFLAIKTAFINEIADLCEKTDANIDMVIRGICLDSKISKKCFNVGPGYSGHSFDKDTRVLTKTAEKLGSDLSIIHSAIKSNDNRKLKMVDRIKNIFESYGGVDNKKLCILGLTSKPETDDVKKSISVSIIKRLTECGAKIVAYDPMYAVWKMNHRKIPDELTGVNIVESLYEAIDNSDAVIIATEWNEFRLIDLQKAHQIMNKFEKSNKPIIVDLRNLFKPSDMMNFEYISIGRNTMDCVL